MKHYLTPDQVNTLNEKHGWFTYGDAQSDVSKAFAQDAIEMHERMRAAAPEMLAALQAMDIAFDNLGDIPGGLSGYEQLHAAAVAASKVIAKATGVPA